MRDVPAGRAANHAGSIRGLQIVVGNPFHAEMVAGKVAGLYESWTGALVRSSWQEQSPGWLVVTMEFVAAES